MPVSIIACPSCKSLLLSDTAQCPGCRHVLRPNQLADSLDPHGADDGSSAEGPCPSCGEMVRHGMVRCWHCGGFMRSEIAAAYERMQASPSPVIYSRSDHVTVPPAKRHAGTPDGDASAPPPVDDDDDDFELAPEIATDETFAGNPGYPDAAPDQNGQPHAPQVATEEPAIKADEPVSAPGDAAATDADEPSETTDRAANPQVEPEVDHSVATGGDVLLKVALQEEAEAARRGKGRRRSKRVLRGFLVYCPRGHRVEVQEKHRGLTGRCPKCKTPFFVPLKPQPEAESTAGETDQAAANAAVPAAAQFGKFKIWMADVRLHSVNPAKLKLKPGSLEKDFQSVDLAFAADGMLLATLVKPGGLFGSPGKKKAAAREAVQAHLSEDKPLDQLPAAAHQWYDAEAMRTVAVAQPYPYAHESMFAGVPVFGNNRIAVRLPKAGDADPPRFVSFALADYRIFAAALADCFGIAGLGEDFGVPLTDSFTELTCHYSDAKLAALESIEYYQADPSFKLELIGRRCAACGLVVSEDSRKKEKIGGANGRGIAKAKCPKCGGKFGDISLYTLPQQSQPEPEASEQPAESESAEPVPAET